ncbi:BrnT family toxin [Thiotrichales bacterium 19S9-12]|nr:BrnT family toxin [Thiotrichales bacterium 19S9-11]MCF6811251.1 BrnT family toxin [Thiotrichales bacterium 19S9-12]
MFEWDKEKNRLLQSIRGISFEEVILAIEKSKNYPDQLILCIRINNYIYAVPAEKRGENIRLITIFKDRKLNKKYGREDNG